jgi:FtsZ-interacting cell division protein ZipA
MNKNYLHIVYIVAIVVLLVGGVIASNAWATHVKDEATRDAVITEQKKEIETKKQEIDDINKKRDADIKALQSQISDIQKQKVQLSQTPGEAPKILEELLRKMNPQAAAIAQTSEIKKDTAPDAVTGQLTKQNYLDLAQAGLSCQQWYTEKQQCDTKLAASEQVVAKQQEIITRKDTELAAANNAAKGGTIGQRIKRNSKWALIGAGIAVGLEIFLGRRH